MKSFIILCILAVVCSTFGLPEVENHALLARSRRDTDFIGNTGKIIHELAKNLVNSAKDALAAVETFRASMRDEVAGVRDKIKNDLSKFKDRVTNAVDNVMQRISVTSAEVRKCIDIKRTEAAAVFNNTMSGTMACVDERIADLSGQIENLTTMANDAMASGSKALEDMRECSTNSTNLLSTGTCLGRVALETEFKSIVFVGEFAVAIGRINVGIATLPASLEVCAAKRLIQTGIDTGKIIIGLGTCSTSKVFNSIFNKPNAK